MAFVFLFGPALAVAPLFDEVASQSKPRYSAEIRRTSHDIPHITAKDMGSLGFGEGYAFAQDHLCSLADQVMKVKGSRSLTNEYSASGIARFRGACIRL